MARSLNKVQLIGNLTRDPELRYTPQGTAVCTFGLATNRSWTPTDGSKERQDEVEFHNIVAWTKLAERVNEYLSKGSKVYVEGRLQTRSWDTPEGEKKYKTEIVAEDVIFLDKLNREDDGGEHDSRSASRSVSPTASGSSSSETSGAASNQPNQDVNPDEIPF